MCGLFFAFNTVYSNDRCGQIHKSVAVKLAPRAQRMEVFDYKLLKLSRCGKARNVRFAFANSAGMEITGANTGNSSILT